MGDYSEEKASRWEASATVAISTDWFAFDIKGSDTGHSYKHTIQMMCPTSTVVNVIVTNNSISKTYPVNSGAALTALVPYQFVFIVRPGDTYNIQHATTTQNVACTIFESTNIDV